MPTVSRLLHEALAHHRSGELAQAERLYRQIVRVDPRHADALHLLGVAAHQQKRHAAAVDCIGRAIAINAAAAMYHGNLAAAYWALGETERSIACYQRATRLSPDWTEAWFNLATVYFAQDRLDEARDCYERGLKIEPNSALAWNNLGSIHRSQSRLTKSTDCFRRALEIDSHYAPAHNNLGNNLLDDGDVTQAIACYERALAADPGMAKAHISLANIHAAAGRTGEAEACYQRASELVPRDDGLKIRSAFLIPVVPESIEQIRNYRQRLRAAIDRLEQTGLMIENPLDGAPGPIFYTGYHGMDDRRLSERIAALYLRATPSLLFTAPHCRSTAQCSERQTAASVDTPESVETSSGGCIDLTERSHIVRRTGRANRERPVRVGCISRFFYHHSVGDHFEGTIRHLPRDDIRLTVFRFPGPDDDISRQIAESADAVVTLPLDLDAARRRIADEQLDVLHYTDIGQEPMTYFLAFSRLAPVQCVTPGHPMTTGIPTIDYYITDADAEPEDADEHYSEQLVRFPTVPNYFYRPHLAGPERSRSDFGLSEDAHLYLCGQSLFKLQPDFDELLAGILRADRRGELILFEGWNKHWTTLLQARFDRMMRDVVDRVRFLPRQNYHDFLQLVRLADVVLDTTHFGSGTTAAIALGLGAAVVTWPGRFLRGRMTYALYRKIGVMDCVAASPQEYVEIAVRLATQPAWRQSVRERIRASNDVLFENADSVQVLARFFREVVDNSRSARKNDSTFASRR